MRLLLSFLSFLVFQSSALADGSHSQYISFLKNNRGLNISKIESSEILNLNGDVFSIEESLHEQLLSVAQSQSEIWADTVLEGGVVALGEIELVSVEELKWKKEVVGYHITYSQRAWDTSNCDLSRADADDYQNPATFAQCAEGKIFEAAYVTADLDTYFADTSDLAHLELN